MPIELSELRKWKRVSLKDYPEISFEARELTQVEVQALMTTKRVLVDDEGEFVHESKSDELETIIRRNSRGWKGVVLEGEPVDDVSQIWEHAPARVAGGITGALIRASTLSGDEMGNSEAPSDTPPGG